MEDPLHCGLDLSSQSALAALLRGIAMVRCLRDQAVAWLARLPSPPPPVFFVATVGSTEVMIRPLTTRAVSLYYARSFTARIDQLRTLGVYHSSRSLDPRSPLGTPLEWLFLGGAGWAESVPCPRGPVTGVTVFYRVPEGRSEEGLSA